jgi:hypothetical protein
VRRSTGQNKEKLQGEITMAAQQNAKQLVTIEGKTVEKLEYQGRTVITLAMMDEVHGRPKGTASRNFVTHKSKFEEGIDYVMISASNEIRTMGITAAPNGLTLLTESGYLKLVKAFTDELAWKVQGQLVECYFRAKQIAPPALPTSNLELMKLAMAAIEDADRKAETAKAQSTQASHLAQTAITRVDNLEAALTTRTEEYCTIAGYCRLNNISMTSPEMGAMGKRARKQSEAMGIHVREMFDPRWGKVGLYHFDALHACFSTSGP